MKIVEINRQPDYSNLKVGDTIGPGDYELNERIKI